MFGSARMEQKIGAENAYVLIISIQNKKKRENA